MFTLIAYLAALSIVAVAFLLRDITLALSGLLLIFTTAPIALALLSAHHGNNTQPSEQPTTDLLRQELRTLAAHAAISDQTRRVLNRAQERQLLRDAIRQDIADRELASAQVLIQELNNRFGSDDEAKDLQSRLDALASPPPDIPIAPGVPFAEAAAQRTEHPIPSARAELQAAVMDAARDGRADDALRLLKELDSYLTPEEAEPYRDMARGIIGMARENLGNAFKAAVQEQRWEQALALGERITADFPNTRMAAEVRTLLEGIRQRSRQTVG